MPPPQQEQLPSASVVVCVDEKLNKKRKLTKDLTQLNSVKLITEI